MSSYTMPPGQTDYAYLKSWETSKCDLSQADADAFVKSLNTVATTSTGTKVKTEGTCRKP